MHKFTGKWITNDEFFALEPRNVFHRQLATVSLPCDEHRDRHILFRKDFELYESVDSAVIYISADDYYKLYINGAFVGQGPSPSYHSAYKYNVIDITDYLKKGRNVIAVHTLYQGLINRVWQSGDNRHGLIFDLLVNDKTSACSDETMKTKVHSAYTEMGTCGFDTQFLEKYDSRSPEIGFQNTDFDDSGWEYSKIRKYADYNLSEQKSYMLDFEKIVPVSAEKTDSGMIFDFGSNYVGYLKIRAKGKRGDEIVVRCGQELNDDKSVRFDLRAICRYEERWILCGGESELDWFDYKAFRYAELIIPENAELLDCYVEARHYPFALRVPLKKEYSDNENLRKIWELCINTQKYGVQEVIQDCMEREKGFYLGDGCYTALTNMILTKDDSMVRKLIDDAFHADFITDGLVTCLDCSFMQEIAEFPLILVFLILWHYRLTGDKEYLGNNFPKVIKLLDSYRRNYEQDGLLKNLDKWCVVEWPKNFQHGYDVDITEGKVCSEAHVAINAYYLKAVQTANKMADILNLPAYRDESPLKEKFNQTFYDEERHLFRDGESTNHISLVGNCFVFGFDMCPDDKCRDNIIEMLKENKISSLSLFCVFPVFAGLVRENRPELIKEMLLDENAWLRMLREGATTTFEGWGKEAKWNTSLFHLTMSYAAAFMADVNLKKIFD